MNFQNYLSIWICEFYCVWEEVQDYLKESTLITIDRAYLAKVVEVFNFGSYTNALVMDLEKHNLNSLINSSIETKVILIKLELIIIKFRHIHQVIYQSLDHSLSSNFLFYHCLGFIFIGEGFMQ